MPGKDRDSQLIFLLCLFLILFPSVCAVFSLTLSFIFLSLSHAHTRAHTHCHIHTLPRWLLASLQAPSRCLGAWPFSGQRLSGW